MPLLRNLFGQDAVVRMFRRALESGTLAGSYLFVGAEGAGKLEVARALAQAATCLHPTSDPFDACGVCDSCRRAEMDAHPEIVVLRPAGEQIQIWQLWDRDGKQSPGVLSRTLPFAPVVGRRRIYILERSDRLTESAANSLLKVLEEPPSYVVFILLAPHAARVLPTVLSRSQIVRIAVSTSTVLANHLISAYSVEPERAAMLASYSEGRIGQAITLAQSSAVGEEITSVLDYAVSLPGAPPARALRCAEQLRKIAAQVSALIAENPARIEEPQPDRAPEASASSRQKNIDKQSDKQADGDKEKVGRRQYAIVLDLLVTFYRDLLAACVGVGEPGLVNRERAHEIIRLSQCGDPQRWMRSLDALLVARRRLDANGNIALVTDVLMMQLLQP